MNISKRHNRAAWGAPARNRLYASVFTALLAICTTTSVYGQSSDTQDYRIQAGSLGDALNQLAAQSKLQIVYPPDLVKGKTAPGLSGRHTLRTALQQLLKGTGLEWGLVNDSTVVIKKGVAKPVKRAKPTPRAEPAAQEEEVKNMPAIMVTKARTLNMDIMRTEDDPQPYVVFEREQIERSGATSLEQFLQQRLTMNTSPVNSGDGSGGATSQISLRGLGATQTLILIDGHRVSSPGVLSTSFGSLNQADITGIPLAAIERIEVLPTTASGIYGGSATGGVINIIMRRDYTGGEIELFYGDAFETDVATKKIDVTAGASFNDGKTNLLLSLSHSRTNDLLVGDRDLVQRGRGAIWKNNLAFFLPPTGRPPLGALPNIASSDGSNLVLDNGLQLNSPFTSVSIGYPGAASDGGMGLVDNAGSYNWFLANSAQADSRGSGKDMALYTAPTVKSGALAIRHKLSERTTVFVDVSSSRSTNKFATGESFNQYLIPADSPNNPFLQDILVTVPLAGADSKRESIITHNRILLGLIRKLSSDWSLGIDYTWDRTTVKSTGGLTATPSFATAVSAGEIDVLRDTNKFPITEIQNYLATSQQISPFISTMKEVSARVGGSIKHISAGAITLSAAISRRDEAIPNSFFYRPRNNLSYFYPERSQAVMSSYLELRIPIFSSKNAKSGFQELELQAALRRDAYESNSGEVFSTFGSMPSPLPEVSRAKNEFSSVDPTIALRWKPWKELALRASYGTGFLPPALDQLVPSVFPVPISAGLDPKRGNEEAGPYTYIYGGNSSLDPEQSKSWSAGLVITPGATKNLRFSIDYTKIAKSGNISRHPGLQQGLINDEDLFPGRVTRGPKLPGDPADWAGPIIVLDDSPINMSSAQLEAWDMQLDITKETRGAGVFEIFFSGTWQPHYRTKTIDGQPERENVGVSYVNPSKLKANAGLSWTNSAWQAGWNTSYFHSYKVSRNEQDLNSQGHDGKVSSQIYHDVFLSYDWGLASGGGYFLLRNTKFSVGVRNVFNKKPPLDVGAPANFYSPMGDPRLRSWFVSITSQF